MPLRILLLVLGWTFTAASRWSRAFRSQLSRDVVLEVRSDDAVARRFVFRGRRATAQSGGTERPDCTLRFATSSQAFSTLTAADGPQRLMDGMLDGTVTIEGNPTLASWFQGLVPAAIPGWPVLRLPATPPHPYVGPTSSQQVSRRIPREAVADELDPAWTNAVVARKKLLMMRVAAGEPLKPF